jgi:hypothetical protein
MTSSKGKAKAKAKAKAKKPASKARPPKKGKTITTKPTNKAKPKAPTPPKALAKAPAGKKPVATPPRPSGPGDAKATAPPLGVTKPAKPAKPKKSRRAPAIRRGPDGEILQPGEILIPGGVHDSDEIHYLFRGSVAAEHAAGDTGVSEVLTKRPSESETDLRRVLTATVDRFDKGPIESMLPQRPPQRRNFQGVVERAKHRRREIGAFLRGLDLGRTETSHMDSHGEASLQSLMEWAARLENLAEADEPDQADYAQFHRGLDQLENTTEALIVDVELTLRRVRDRARAR